MSLTLYVLGGVGLLGGLLWLIGRLAQPPKLTGMSSAWMEDRKYDKRQHRPD